jgi:hypothetical protein
MAAAFKKSTAALLALVLCHNVRMKPKTCDEGPTALRNFTRTMQALFRVPKAEVVEPKHKPASRKKHPKP